MTGKNSCWPWQHQWSKWEPRYMDAVEISSFTLTSFDVTKWWQERRCNRCGIFQQNMMSRPGHDARKGCLRSRAP
jgi:hypothetical protein